MAVNTLRRIDVRRGRSRPPASEAYLAPLWDWERLSPRDREGAWTELREWVANVVTGRYGLGRRLPACWTRHADLAEDILQLHEWEAALWPRSRTYQLECEAWVTALHERSGRWPGFCPEHGTEPVLLQGLA